MSAVRRLFLLFRLGDDRYALAADAVVRVLPLQALKQLPGTPDWVAGVLVHRGAPVPVIDLGGLALGRPSRHLTSTRIVLVTYRHRGLGAARTLALILEGVTETGHRNPADFVPCGLDSPRARYLGPVLDEAEGMLQWVDVDALLSDEARALLFPDALAGEPACS